ncbi:MAG: CDP-alcohol phosphatidyltransferase family protein [Jiangellales bacterium]
MLSSRVRPMVARVFDPIARGLLRLGLTPDMVTVIGTAAVVTTALVAYPNGWLLPGTLLIAVFVFADSLDGTMARLSGRSSDWGAFLDSTLDRLADASIFAGLTLWFAADGNMLGVALTLASLVLGQLVSYARARAEGLGATAAVGVAERSERLIVVLLAAGFVGLGLSPTVLVVAMAVLAIASAVTVVQRMIVVRRQLGGVSSQVEES